MSDNRKIDPDFLTDLPDLVVAIGDERTRVTSPPAAPITREDLLRLFETRYDAETAAQLAGDLTPSGPGQMWTTDILLGVAALSPDHGERIRAYLGLTVEQIDEALVKFQPLNPWNSDKGMIDPNESDD